MSFRNIQTTDKIALKEKLFGQKLKRILFAVGAEVVKSPIGEGGISCNYFIQPPVASRVLNIWNLFYFIG